MSHFTKQSRAMVKGLRDRGFMDRQYEYANPKDQRSLYARIHFEHPDGRRAIVARTEGGNFTLAEDC